MPLELKINCFFYLLCIEYFMYRIYISLLSFIKLEESMQKIDSYLNVSRNLFGSINLINNYEIRI